MVSLMLLSILYNVLCRHIILTIYSLLHFKLL